MEWWDILKDEQLSREDFIEQFERVKDPNHPVHSVPYGYDQQGNPLTVYDPQSMDIGRPCEYQCGGNRVHLGHGAIGCTTDDCVANTADAMQGSNTPQDVMGHDNAFTKVGEVTPTKTQTEYVDPSSPEEKVSILDLIMPKDPNAAKEDPYLYVDANKPQNIYQTVDRAGNPVPTFRGFRHPDITTGEPMNLSWRLLKSNR